MWAQLIEMRLGDGQDPSEMIRLIRAAEQTGSGLVQSYFMRDQADQQRVITPRGVRVGAESPAA